MVTIALVGAGQIGSRHLQALAGSNRIDAVEVVGRSPRSLETAASRYREVARTDSPPVCFRSRIAELSDAIDVAVIATNADNRLAVLQELIRSKRVGALILEKVVFQAPGDFATALAELRAHGVPAWVNCWRRFLPLYSGLRDAIGSAPLSMTVDGGEWGMGCNAVHYLDLCAFLGGDDRVRIDAPSKLGAELRPSKRAGFIEFAGRLTGQCGERHRFELVARAGSSDAATISLQYGGLTHVVDETGLPLQSKLTHRLVEEILDRGDSSLPNLEESYRVHAPLLEHFAAHLEAVTGRRYNHCPIT
jgi:predicted dehydrogenase